MAHSQFIVRGGADFSELEKKMQALDKKLKNFGKQMGEVGKTLTAAITLPVIAAGTASFKLASDFQESLNKADVAFGNNSKEVTDWSKTTLKSFGIAQGSALDMAALFGDMGTSMGLSTGEASKMSQSLVGLAGDLASFKNIGIEQAQTALNSIFTGETESLKSLGVVMTQANLQQFAYSQGIQKNIKDMTQAEQVQLRYNYVLDKTNNAQGDFARTGGGAANQMRVFSESLKELGASFGNILLPIITPTITKLNGAIQKFSGLDESTKKLIITFAGIAAAIGPALLIAENLFVNFGRMRNSIMALQGAFTVMTGPIGVAVLAIGAAIAIGVALYQNWDSISKWLKSAWESIGSSASAIFKGISDAVTRNFNIAKDSIKSAINGIIGMINKFIKFWNGLEIKVPSVNVPLVGKVGGFSVGLPDIPQIPMLANGGIVNSPTLAMIGEAGPEAVVPLDKGFGGGITVNVYGSVGVDDIGEQLVRTLRRKGVMSLA